MPSIDFTRSTACAASRQSSSCSTIVFWPRPRCLANAFVAVDFFFILSGFVLCHAYGEKLRQGMTFAAYVARRIGRLYPLVMIGVLIGAPHFYQTINGPGDFTRRDFAVALATNLSMVPYLTAKSANALGVFPTNNNLWSIAFEMLASMSLPLLLRLDTKRLRHFCLASLAILIVSALLRGTTAYHPPLFDPNGGWNIENFYGGFPRVFFGFSCGMLLYRLHHNAAERTARASERSPWLLYAGLVAILMCPVYLTGLYALLALAILAPLLVWFGSFSICRNRFTVRASEFLGWLSYPLYCVHRPIVDGMTGFYRRSDLLSRHGIPEQIPAIALALVLSILTGMLVDRLKLQRKLTDLLNRRAARLA